MITFLEEVLPWLALAAVVGVGSTYALRAIAGYCRLRARELEASRSALELYERILDEVLEDPATPDSAKRLLFDFDAGVMDRRVAWFIAQHMFREGSDFLKPRFAPDDAFDELREVSKTRPDLYEKFTRAVALGFVATMKAYTVPARALSMMYIDPERDPITPAQAVACAAEQVHPHALPVAA